MLNRLNNFLSAIIVPASAESRPENTLQLATAVLLIEVMKSDADMAIQEQDEILKILKEKFHLSDVEVTHLTELGHRTASAANDFHQFTSIINRELQPAEKIRIIEYMWQVAYADGKISAHENHLMRKISDLLYIPHRDYIAAKMRAKPADLE
ncbi:MAG: TerB family tellurite resistance protein [Gammaproteobacteria bacterium]|nr:TerB family tellurite resistance protein [Gammaproteobacteria bacterium]MBU1776718.1 TerB family tellurite resistance protein [Gammaproteobacteria bacterium]MBU1969489.1 TerB family tellurite resistance protein [Gammaproteobacteria bacterium]